MIRVIIVMLLMVVVVIVLVLAGVVAFLVMLDVSTGSDAFEVGFEFTLPLLLGQRADLHVDVTPCHFWLLIHMSHVEKIFFDLFCQGVTEFLMGDLATTELKLDAHFVTFGEEIFSVDDLDEVVVRIDADAEFQLLHFATFVVLVSFLLVLLLHVFVFAVIDDLADRRFGIGGDFDQIESTLLGHANGLMRGQDAILSVVHPVHDANFWRADALINARLVNEATIVGASTSLWPATTTHRAITTTHRWSITSCGSATHWWPSCGAWAWRWGTERTLACWRWGTCRTRRRVGVCLSRTPCELVAAQVLEWVANRIPPGWIRNSKNCQERLFERVLRVAAQ